MANVFLDLPVPAGNGVGVAVDTSSMGRARTITVNGTGSNPSRPFEASITIEFSVDGGATFFPLHTFTAPGKKTFDVAADFMRVRVSNFVVGNGLNVDVASNDDGVLTAALPAPGGDGVGAAVDVSALGTFNTVVCGGTFSGSVTIEASEDGVDYTPCVTFTTPGGVQSKEVVAQFMRVRRTGVSSTNPGTPVVGVAAVNDATPGGGGGGGSGSICLVYRQGAADAGPVVFGTWAGLMAQLNALRAANGGGCYRIEFDNSVTTPMSIPSGAYDMTDVEWHVAEDRNSGGLFTPTGRVQINLDPSVTLTGLRRFTGPMIVQNTSSVSVPCTDLVAEEQVTLRDGAQLAVTTGGVPALPVYRISGLAAAERVFFDFADGAGLTAAVGEGSAGSVVDLTDVGATVEFRLGGGSLIAQDTVAVVGGSRFEVDINAADVFLGRQAAVAGLTVKTFNADVRWRPKGVRTSADATPEINDFTAFDVSAGAVSQPLPAISGSAEDTEGMCYAVVETSDSAGLTLTPAVGDTVGGGSSLAVPAGAAVVLVSDGVSDWRVMSLSLTAPKDKYSPPEKWVVAAIASGAPATPMNALVSTSFDDIQMIRSGSIVGLNARLAAALTGGSVTVTVTVNGAAATLSTTIAAPDSDSRATQPPGVDTFSPGDRVGIQYSSAANTLPATALEAWLEVEVDQPAIVGGGGGGGGA